MENIKFSKKTINMPDNFNDMSTEINIVLDKNEEAIREYITRYIYTSNISLETNKQLNEIFKKVRKDVSFNSLN